MGNLIEDFQKEGLLPERMVSNPTAGGQNEELPKINPDVHQTPAVKDVVGTAGDQNKAQDPTKPANEVVKEDKMIKSAAASINAAECAMESVCEHANRQQEAMGGGCGYVYDEDKKKKLSEIHEGAKQLNQSISALMNQAPMTSTPTPNQTNQNPSPQQPAQQQQQPPLSPVQNQGQVHGESHEIANLIKRAEAMTKDASLGPRQKKNAHEALAIFKHAEQHWQRSKHEDRPLEALAMIKQVIADCEKGMDMLGFKSTFESKSRRLGNQFPRFGSNK